MCSQGPTILMRSQETIIPMCSQGPTILMRNQGPTILMCHQEPVIPTPHQKPTILMCHQEPVIPTCHQKLLVRSKVRYVEPISWMKRPASKGSARSTPLCCSQNWL